MAITLYRRQKQILDFLYQYIQSTGFSPTLSEIAQALGVSSLATVHEHLQVMIHKGLIKKYKGSVRGIEVVNPAASPANNLDLPVLGFIAAGKPIEPFTDPNYKTTVPINLVSGKKRAFVLQVKGESMIEDGILDGDLVVIEEQNQANNGDIVVALLENGFSTLKRFYKETTRVRLEPANSAMNPIFAKNVRIQGKVVGLVRRYPQL